MSQSKLHPAFRPLVEKLADSKYSVRDCSGERLDWIKAGCPILDPELEHHVSCLESFVSDIRDNASSEQEYYEACSLVGGK